MRLIADAIEKTPPHPQKSWNHRIVLGCWAVSEALELHQGSWVLLTKKKAKYIPLCALHLPNFPIMHIGFSLSYARRFFSIPNVSFNMLQKILMGPAGARFLRDARRLGRPVLCWTVNEENLMRWSIKNGLDGVITDDPKSFLEVCDQWEQGKRKIYIQPKDFLLVLWLNLMVALFGRLFQWKYPFKAGLSYKKARGFVKLWHRFLFDKKIPSPTPSPNNVCYAGLRLIYYLRKRI